MKTTTFFLLVILLSVQGLFSLVLEIPNVQQQESNWCWAGCSEAILSYYGFNYSQDEIADYGTEGLNTWNWLWGESESPTRRGIDMILQHFGQIESSGTTQSLTLEEIYEQIDSMRPFVIRWEWNNNGGHFIVGKGYYDNLIFAMDPINGNPTYNDYEWFCQSNDHTWTHTLSLVTSPTSTDEDIYPEVGKTNIYNYPNPFKPAGNDRGPITTFSYELKEYGYVEIKIFNLKGQLVKNLVEQKQNSGIHEITWDGKNNRGTNLSSGIYYYRLKIDGGHIDTKRCILLK